MRNVKVAGIGLLKVKEYWDRSIQDLFVDASLKAIKDSGGESIDGAPFSYPAEPPASMIVSVTDTPWGGDWLRRVC